MIVIDGSTGEGGGQVLRTSLSLALVTGKAVRVENIRASRSKPGLLRQHLTAVQAATGIGRARVTGAELNSREIEFVPGEVCAGEYRFAIGTAGSTTLVLQTILPPLLTANGPSEIVLEGGTHNPFAPPFDFLARAFLPVLGRMGARVEAVLERPGFFPAGGGRLRVRIEPVAANARLGRLDLLERGEARSRRARALLASLPRDIGERELEAVAAKLGWATADLTVEELSGTSGPGNVLVLEIESEHATEVVTSFGERGLRAEEVGRKAVEQARRYLASMVPVGEHLADQLLLPMAMAGAGSFRTLALSRHATTNIETIRRFLDVEIAVITEARDVVRVEFGRKV